MSVDVRGYSGPGGGTQQLHHKSKMFFRWHENKYEQVRNWLGWSHYQMAWLGGLKGLLYGLLIGYLLF